MKVYVLKVSIPAMSTVGYGEGYSFGECGHLFTVSFVGDHRPMRDLGQALASTGPGEDPPLAEVPDHAITSVQPVKEGYA